MNRARLARQEARIHDLTQQSLRWKEDEQILNMRIRHLESDKASLESDKTGLEAQLQDLSLSRHAIAEELEAQRRTCEENASLLGEARGEVLHLKAELAGAEEQAALTRSEIERMQECKQQEIDEAVCEAVKHYPSVILQYPKGGTLRPSLLTT